MTTGRVEDLRREAAACRNCDLWANARQTVFGEGASDAEIMLVGEQPGDQEDKKGAPFVGPAGRILDRVLNDAGIDRGRTYVTNAVKHFRWEPSGKRRIHKRPNRRQIAACLPWLEREIETVAPKLVVCLGSVAAQALLGPGFKVTQHRGEVIEREGLPPVMCTIHPSAVLRSADDETRHEQIAGLTADLRQAVDAVSARGRRASARRPR